MHKNQKQYRLDFTSYFSYSNCTFLKTLPIRDLFRNQNLLIHYFLKF